MKSKMSFFLGKTEIFKERKHMAFLRLLGPTNMQNRANLAEPYLIFVGICS